MALCYTARDQYGDRVDLFTEHPRKELMEHCGRKSADRMYEDLTTGGSRHIGWVIAGRWFQVWKTVSLSET